MARGGSGREGERRGAEVGRGGPFEPDAAFDAVGQAPHLDVELRIGGEVNGVLLESERVRARVSGSARSSAKLDASWNEEAERSDIP